MSGALNWVGETIGGSYGPHGFEPLALLSPQLREQWAADRKAHIDDLESQAEDRRVGTYLRLGRQVEQDASAAIESGNFEQAAALSRQSGELSAEGLRRRIEARGQVGGAPVGSMIGETVAQGNEAIASSEGQRRAGGTPTQIAARGKELQAARTELGAKSGAPASSQFVTPGQAGAFASNAASARAAEQAAMGRIGFESGLRTKENIRQEGAAAGLLRTKQTIDIETTKRQERIRRREAIRLDKERTIQPRQFEQFMENVNAGAKTDPAIFENNPRLKTMAIMANALNALPENAPAKVREKTFNEVLDAAQGVTRTQTQAITGEAGRELDKEQRHSVDALVQMETLDKLAEDNFFGVTGFVGDAIQAASWLKIDIPQAKAWLDRRTTWRYGNSVLEKDALLDVAATTFTDEVREWVHENLVPSESDSNKSIYHQKMQAAMTYQAYKSAGVDAFRVQKGGSNPTPYEMQIIISRALMHTAQDLGKNAPSLPNEGQAPGAISDEEAVRRYQASGGK